MTTLGIGALYALYTEQLLRPRRRACFTSQEDYIVKNVDLLSGFGGAMGLWLGWSVLSLGNSIVKAFRTVTSVKLFK